MFGRKTRERIKNLEERIATLETQLKGLKGQNEQVLKDNEDLRQSFEDSEKDRLSLIEINSNYEKRVGVYEEQVAGFKGQVEEKTQAINDLTERLAQLEAGPFAPILGKVPAPEGLDLDSVRKYVGDVADEGYRALKADLVQKFADRAYDNVMRWDNEKKHDNHDLFFGWFRTIKLESNYPGIKVEIISYGNHGDAKLDDLISSGNGNAADIFIQQKFVPASEYKGCLPNNEYPFISKGKERGLLEDELITDIIYSEGDKDDGLVYADQNNKDKFFIHPTSIKIIGPEENEYVRLLRQDLPELIEAGAYAAFKACLDRATSKDTLIDSRPNYWVDAKKLFEKYAKDDKRTQFLSDINIAIQRDPTGAAYFSAVLKQTK